MPPSCVDGLHAGCDPAKGPQASYLFPVRVTAMKSIRKGHGSKRLGVYLLNEKSSNDLPSVPQ